ncbi:1-acyl-sn-glycerol-3-phosphate acyltransferase, partial [Myxococcota bacterium]|nr:1-acyl-sn-glycerol-3-phosphate acyltransferase [Myxococcota bacterium]
ERVIAGPQLPPFESVLRHVLRNPKLKEVIKSESLVQQKSEAALEKKASQYLREIAARFKVPFIQGLSVLLSVVFNRIYDGVVIDRKGLKRILQASRKGQIVFCPAHRSHVDYLVLSYVLWNEGVVPPHIAAGANLSFFPLGTIFRGSGAFFLRRAFRTNKVYGAVFRSYIHELIHQGTSIEFFIEGTRSRTGKLLMPRYGLLSMVVDAWRRGAREDVYFAPVSIDYERIIEAGSYEKELSGAEKKQEDIGGLLKSTGVLRSRYGRVHVQFGKPLSLREFAENAGLPRESGEESDQQWKIYVEKLAFQILYGVAKIGTVTPTSVVATALLGYQGRGLAESTLLAHCSDILDFLDLATGRLSNALEDSEGRNTILLGAVHKLIDDGIVVVDRPGRSDAEPIYRVPSNRRMILDYHKNAVMNL